MADSCLHFFNPGQLRGYYGTETLDRLPGRGEAAGSRKYLVAGMAQYVVNGHCLAVAGFGHPVF